MSNILLKSHPGLWLPPSDPWLPFLKGTERACLFPHSALKKKKYFVRISVAIYSTTPMMMWSGKKKDVCQPETLKKNTILYKLRYIIIIIGLHLFCFTIHRQMLSNLMVSVSAASLVLLSLQMTPLLDHRLPPLPCASSRPSPACHAGPRSPRFSGRAPPAAPAGCPRRFWRSRTRRLPATSPWRWPAERGRRS